MKHSDNTQKLQYSTRGRYHKTFLGINLLTLCCKLDHFKPMQQILLMFIKLASLQKSISTFIAK
jgi:hypothetical protein